jgi:hypothetical protein
LNLTPFLCRLLVSRQSASHASLRGMHFSYDWFRSESFPGWCLLLIACSHNLSKNSLFLLFYGSHDAYLLFHLAQHPDLSSDKDLMSCLYCSQLLAMRHDFVLEVLVLHFFILLLILLFNQLFVPQLNLNL